MADTAAQSDEQDFSIPGQDEADAGGIAGAPQTGAPAPGGAQAPPQAQNAGQPTPGSGGVASTNDDDQSMPKASGRALVLGNLLKTILSGTMAGVGNSNPARAKGFQAAQQAAEQAKNDQIKAQASLDEHQQNLVKMHAAQMQQALMAHQMVHLDDAHNEKIVDSLEKASEFDRKEGLMQDEQEIDGEGMNAYSTAVKMAGQLNGKQGMGAKERYKVGITDGSDLAHLKFNVYKTAMDGKVTRDVFTGLDDDGKPQYKSMSGKYVDLDAAEQANRTKATQDATKDSLKEIHKTLGNQKPPEAQDEADFRLSQLNAVLQTHPDPVAKQLAQQEKDSIQKNYQGLPKTQAEAKKAAKAPAQGKAQDLVVGQDEKGNQVAVPFDQAKNYGLKDSYKVGAAEAEKITTARTLVKQFDKANTLLDDLNSKGQLGVIASRWNELARKAGPGDPEFTRLMTQMGLNETALMQVHVGARGSSQLLEHFHDLANAGKMTYPNIKAAIDQEQDYVKDKAMMPGRGGSSQQQQHTAGGPAQGLQEGATGTGSDGQKYIVKGGKWAKATVQ